MLFLIEQIFAMIETKQLKAAEALLEKARNVYESAGVVVIAQENDIRFRLTAALIFPRYFHSYSLIDA